MPAAEVLNTVIFALELLILGRVLWSWVDRDPFSDNPVRRVLWQLTEPLLDPIRRLVPPIGGAIDVSPVIAIVALQVLQQILLRAVGP